MSNDTVRVRVTGRQFRHDGEEYLHGDELTVPQRAIEGWSGRVEVVDEGDESGPSGGADVDASGETDADETVEVDPHPSDLTVSELEARISDVDDAELLQAIREEEAASDEPRTTALDAIDDRLDELEG